MYRLLKDKFNVLMSHSLKRRNAMDKKELIAFIVFAKKNGYANKEGATEIIKYEKSGAVKIIVRKDNWEYSDKYVGSEYFIGQEIVYFQGKPVWSMSYHGRVQTDDEQIKPELIAFLKNALLTVNEKEVFRGQHIYIESDFTYVNVSDGTINFFHGDEIISQRSKVGKLYELHYNGGSVQ